MEGTAESNWGDWSEVKKRGNYIESISTRERECSSKESWREKRLSSREQVRQPPCKQKALGVPVNCSLYLCMLIEPWGLCYMFWIGCSYLFKSYLWSVELERGQCLLCSVWLVKFYLTLPISISWAQFNFTMPLICGFIYAVYKFFLLFFLLLATQILRKQFVKILLNYSHI